MEEKRKEQRLKNENEISVTIVDDEKKPVEGKSMDNNHSMDISVSGVRIKSHVSLPVDTLIRIKMKLKNLGKMITNIGKVKWTKGNIEDKSYEAGVEFVDTPDESVLILEEYINQGVDRHVYKDE